MEAFWYPFLYFCCNFLKDFILKTQRLKNPAIQDIMYHLDEFIIRGNMERGY